MEEAMARRSPLWVGLLPWLSGILGLALVVAFWSWLPLLFSAPWLMAIVYLRLRDGFDSGDPASAAEEARRRLWT
jgi:hypothetical protein